MWEDALSMGLANQSITVDIVGDPRKGQPSHKIKDFRQVTDGIIISPDEVEIFNDGYMRVWEYKFTWQSSRINPPEVVWKYMVQVKGYCHCLGTNEAIILAMYSMGEHQPPMPKPIGRRIIFTDQEIEENWAMLTNAKKSMEKEGLIVSP